MLRDEGLAAPGDADRGGVTVGVVGVCQNGAVGLDLLNQPVPGVVLVAHGAVLVCYRLDSAGGAVGVTGRTVAVGDGAQPVGIGFVGIGSRVAVEVGVAEFVAVGVIGEGFGLTFGQSAAGLPTEVVVGPGGGSASGVDLAVLVASFVAVFGSLANGINDSNEVADGVVLILRGPSRLVGLARLSAQSVVTGGDTRVVGIVTGSVIRLDSLYESVGDIVDIFDLSSECINHGNAIAQVVILVLSGVAQRIGDVSVSARSVILILRGIAPRIDAADEPASTIVFAANNWVRVKLII